MTKKRSKVKLCIVAVLTLIGLFLTFFQFIIPTTNTTFKGFINAINYGYDLDGGTLAVYKAQDDSITGFELENKLNKSVSNLNTYFSDYGFVVTKQNDYIRIQASKSEINEIETLLSSYSIDIFDLIGSENGLSFNSDSSESGAEGSIGGQYLSSCTFQYINNSWCIVIEFNDEGKTLFKDLTTSISLEDDGKLYMYVDGTNYNSSGFEITSGISSLTLTASTQTAAKALALQINSLSNPMLLEVVVSDTISAGLDTGVSSFLGNQSSLLICALVLLAIATFIFFMIRYRVLGLFASFAILIYIVIYSFLLQSIPLICIDFNGLIGILASFFVLIFGIVSIFERIKKEYQNGKKIPNSVMSGFRKNIIHTLETYIYVLLLMVIFYLTGFIALSYFAASLFVGLFVNFFTLFVVLRGLVKIYLPINSTKPKQFNLKREGVKNEI